MAVKLLGFPTTLGLPRTVRQHGPEALRANGFSQTLELLGSQVEDLGDLPLAEGNLEDKVELRLQKVVQAAQAQAAKWQEVYRPGDLMVTLGGDHTTSLGTIWALADRKQSFDVIWIDAHGDINLQETSPTGRPHGMVLALACGLMPQFMPKLISPADLRLWGIRDLDAGEKLLLERERVEVLDPAQTRLQWDELVSQLKPNVFISFDVDSVNPAEAPGTMTPVPNGFSRQEALDLVSLVARHRNVLALDIVELNPDLDEQNLTTNLAIDVARAVVAGQAAYHQTGG